MERTALIGGEWRAAASGKTDPVVNPATGGEFDRVPHCGREDTKAAIDAARESFNKGTWSRITPGERARVLLKFADLIELAAKPLAELESRNQGKTIKLARDSDIPFAIDNLRFFAGAGRVLGGTASQEYWPGGTSIIRREPVGVVASIAPWNYPVMIAIWKIAPALAAGNSVVLKPSSFTPLTALELGQLGQKAGLPEGVLNVVTGPGSEVGQTLAESDDVDLISLTGGTETGIHLMASAAKTVKRVHLELGGKAPFIVFDDADLDAASTGAVIGALINGGQDCTAACRVLVHEKVRDRFLKAYVEKTRRVRIGDPLDEKTGLGPLVADQHRKKVREFIEIGEEEGAKKEFQGSPPKEKRLAKGFFQPPVIFTDVEQDMRIVQEEIFGPVMTVQPFRKEAQAVEMSNDVVQGLYASVWTKDVHRAHRVANGLTFGTVCVNDHLPLASEMPHGGFKQSGFGKDLSITSFEEYTRIKHVFIDLEGKVDKFWHNVVYEPGR